MDKIEIRNLEIFANHGVFPEENVLGQKFVVSATLYTDTRKAGLTDELTASIHYGEVSHMITKFAKEHTPHRETMGSCRASARYRCR